MGLESMGLDGRAVGEICIPLTTERKVWGKGCGVLCHRSEWKPGWGSRSSLPSTEVGEGVCSAPSLPL